VALTDGVSFLLPQLGDEVILLRNVLSSDSSDEAVLKYARERDCVLLTCNRDDFLHLAKARPHRGIVVLIRRRIRADERAALFRLLERAGAAGFHDNLNLA
jgi:predicted nuclease of predicted toxin-antitoxin system